jgi:hypothetical protein
MTKFITVVELVEGKGKPQQRNTRVNIAMISNYYPLAHLTTVCAELWVHGRDTPLKLTETARTVDNLIKKALKGEEE